MKKRICILALLPFGLIGCADNTPVTTTTMTREYTTTGPVGGDVVVAEEPPAVRVETQPGAPRDQTTFGTPVTGDGLGSITSGFRERVVRPRMRAAWVQGHWVRRPGGYVWISGYWR